MLYRLLDESDIRAVLSKLSPLGKAMLKRIGFNSCELADFEGLSDAQESVFRMVDLNDDVKRRNIINALLHKEFRMSAFKVNRGMRYFFLRNPNFPEGVVAYVKTNLLLKCCGIIEIGSLWKVHVSVQKRAKIKWGNKYLFVADKIEPCDSSTSPNNSTVEGTFGFVARSVKPSKINPACLPRNRNKKPVATRPQEGVSSALDSNSGSHISIYIDETWPGTQDHAYENIGVIGGIVVPWEGVDEKRLPVVKTHLDNGSAARNAIQTMLRRSTVFPFVLPIKWDHAVGAGGRQYFELVQHALMLLLGWMLPQRGQPTTVDIFLEHISGYMDGHDETNFISSLTQAMRLLSGGRRFANWQIRRVEWVDKEFGYVPYGDLVCKTCVPREEQQLLAREVKVREWEGFLPFSKDVFPLLRDMDTASPSGLADLLISFAKQRIRRSSAVCERSRLIVPNPMPHLEMPSFHALRNVMSSQNATWNC